MDQASERKQILRRIFLALSEKGYDPYVQLTGFLITGDPTYITSHDQARYLAQRLDREAMMRDMVKAFVARMEDQKQQEECAFDPGLKGRAI